MLGHWPYDYDTWECPWSKAAKTRRSRQIAKLLDSLPADEVAVYEDENDIHLNPKIALDGMVACQQKEDMTPGQNQKWYLSDAQDELNGQLIWAEGDKKDSLLFIRLRWDLMQRCSMAKKIHVILDNYLIHHTQLVQLSLDCPDHNRIEWAWQDLRANVTRNHTCTTIDQLMSEVSSCLQRNNDIRLQEYAIAA